MKNRMAFRSALLVVLLSCMAFAGCAWRDEYLRPNLSIPEQWQGATTGQGVAARQRWWEAFDDPRLTALIDRALKTNNDLAAAAVLVRRAQLRSGLADTNLTPTVRVGVDGGVSRNFDAHSNTKNYSVSASLSYEIDLWGKLARERDVAVWEAEATELDRQNAALALIGTTAQLYWEIAYQNQRIGNNEANLAYAQRTLDLVAAQKEAGAVSALDLAQAEQNLANQKANHESLLLQREQKRHALAILFDHPPTQREEESSALPQTRLPPIRAGLPVEILARRPDLVAAELRLRMVFASIDVARASFYPSFSLTGNLGSSSAKLSDVLQDPVGTLGLGLVLPFIQWNTAQLTVDIARTEYEEAVIRFRQTLYAALLDVEDALVARDRYEIQREQLQTSFTAAQRAEFLSEIRYRAGATGVKTWLDAQNLRRSAEDALLQNRLDRLLAQLTVYKALGGDDAILPAE
jgi:NodT family efflux transporter outer membrane factor (OMF) lipoprotein